MTNLQVLNIYASIFFGHFASIIVDYLVFPNMCYYLSQVVTYFPARIELAKFAIHFLKVLSSHIHKTGIDMNSKYEGESLDNRHG